MDRKRALAADTRPAATNKDPYTFAKEKERFLKDLRQFHDGRGTTIPRLPYIGGKPVDLYALYTAVTQLGGWEKVSSDETWADIQEQFGIPASCSNADHALRQIYIRYLNAYEKLHHFGLDPDSREDTTDLDDLPSSRKKTAGPVGGVALTYNYQQHNIHDSMREMLGLPKEIGRPSEYANLERSLMSGLPNEIDFAVNICLLLSTEGKHTLKGSKGLRIVELLLSHVGICKEAELALIWLISESKLNFLRFWNESVDDRSVKELVCPECLLIDRVEEYRRENRTVEDDVDASAVLNLGRGAGMEDHEAQRVIQLAVITRNLSFEEENLEAFASSLMVLRFIMLCAYNKHGCIRQLALDTMANVAIKMTLEPVDCGMTQLVLRTVSSCLLSWDKFQVVSALETLSRLCQMELNEEAICCQLDDAVYEHLIRLLTIQDLQLMVSALETIYQLSEIGTMTSNRIAQVSASVDILVALLTFEAEAYGPNALLGVSAAENTTEIPNPVHGQTMGPPPARLPSVVPRLPMPCAPPHLSITQMNPSFLPPRPPLLASTAPAPVAPSPLAATIRCSLAPGVVDSEAAACNWLQAQYELSPNCSVKKMDMYRKYVSTFGMYGLQNLVSPTCFTNCIRVAFPGVEQESMDKDGTSEVVYKGLTSRQKPGPFSPATGDFPSGQQTIPNMSAADAIGSVKTGLGLSVMASTQPGFSGTNSSQLVASFPAIQQVLLSNQGKPDLSADSHSALAPWPTATGPCESNFVKTLLASKVTQNLNRLQNQQVVDACDVGVLPSVQQNGAAVLNSLPVISTCSSPSGPAVVGCSESVKLLTTTASDAKPNATLATSQQSSLCSRTLGSSVPTLSEVNKSVLNEHSYIQTSELFHSKPDFHVSGQTMTAVISANRSLAEGGKSGTVVDGRSNAGSDGCRGLDSVSAKTSADETVCDRANSFELNIGVGGDLNSLELACDSAVGFPECHVSASLPAVMNGSLSLCLNSEKCKSDVLNVRSVSSGNNTVAENMNGKELGPLVNGIVRGIVNGDCTTEKSNLAAELQDNLARKSNSSKDDNEIVDSSLNFQKQCLKMTGYVKKLAVAEDTDGILAGSTESNAKDLGKLNKLSLPEGLIRSENGSRASDGTSLCYQASAMPSGDRYRDTECSYDMSCEELSPFPSTLSNVDGISDDVPQVEDINHGPVQRTDNENDRKINSDPNHLLPDQTRVDLDPSRNVSELDLNSDCPFGEGMSATTENSDILLLEDFTVAHEEVLISDALQDQSNVLTEEADYPLNPTDSQFSISVPESGPSNNPAEFAHVAATSSVSQIQRPQVPFSSQPQVTAFQNTVKDALPSMSNTSLSAPIHIPASIQARLASLQLNSVSFSAGVQSRLPVNAFRPTVSQMPISSTVAIPNQPNNSHSVSFFPQTCPTNDTGQQSQPAATTSVTSGLQTSLEISTSHTAPSSQVTHPLEGVGNATKHPAGIESQVAVASTLPAGFPVAGNQSTENPTPAMMNSSLLSQNHNQMIISQPQGLQHNTVHPLLPQNSSLFVTPSSSSPASQGARIQFLSSSLSSSPSQPPQMHKFVSTTTPGHIIIQRAQMVPQQQQQQPLRPLPQPIFQRFFISQTGGMPQRQIVIQSNPMLLHQGASQVRPGFVQQSGQLSSSSGQQPLVMQSSGQMLPPQQKHVVQAGQLTGFRLIQQQMIGQQGQGLTQRPVLMQQGGQQGQVMVQQQQGQVMVQQQQGQVMVQQHGHHSGPQDAKAGPIAAGVGQTFAHQGQALDQQGRSHGQMLGQGQIGQMITQQSQAGQMITQQGQAGQVTTHQGQAGQVITQQGQAGQVITQQGQAGQVITQQGQAGQVIMQQGQAGQVIMQQGQAGQVIMQQGHMITQQGQAGQVVTQQGQMIAQQGQMVTQQGQLGQMITQQGQVGHIFTQQGQLLVGQQGQILCHAGQQGPATSQASGPLVIQHSGGQIVLQGGSGGLQNCIMFQQGVKRMVEAAKDQTATSSLGLPTSATSYRIITANTALHSGNTCMTNIQPLQVSAGSQVSIPAAPPASPSSVSSGSASKKRKTATATNNSRSAKKRKKDDEESVGGDCDSAQGKAQQVQYVCEWNGCQRWFGSFSSILQHAKKEHFEANKESAITCEWAGCDGLKRQRWSFMTHLQDRHINEANLKAAAARRQQQVPSAATPPPSVPPVPPTAVYPPNAALQAIRRFSARPPFAEMLDAKETPVTKHIHLTSALILRNLARYSALGRSLIKRHEKHLAFIAFSETESSSAISNCLWELQGL